eukprot:9352483-Heterocapsa_arctica.AAC.1
MARRIVLTQEREEARGSIEGPRATGRIEKPKATGRRARPAADVVDDQADKRPKVSNDTAGSFARLFGVAKRPNAGYQARG